MFLQLFDGLSQRLRRKGHQNRLENRQKKKTRKSTIVYKDLILLPTATTRTVPTHQTRCQLENNGFVIHGCPIDKSWEESELKHKIKEWFPILEENDIDFDFVKSCYGQIVTPKLAAGVKFTAARALSLSGQGSIYIRQKEDIPNENDDADLLGEGNGNAEYSDNSYIESSSLASTSQEQVLMPLKFLVLLHQPTRKT